MNLADLRAFITNTGSMLFQIDSDNDSTLDAFEFLGTNNIQLLIEDGDEADIKADGTVISNGIDYAEAFRVDQSSIGPGDVVRLVSGQWEFAELATRAYDALGIGVVSTRPAFLAGMSFNQEDAMDPALTAARDAARAAGDDTLARQLTSQMVELVRQAYRPVAMVGRVPCKVDASYGAIRAGDRLTTSPNPGHAMVQAESGPSIGIALEDRLSGQGMIMVFVQPGWHGLQQGDGTTVTKVPNVEFKGANEAIDDRVAALLRSNRELRDRMAELEAVVQTLLAQQRADTE